MKTIRQIINDEPDSEAISDQELIESLVGKGFSIAQNRQHHSIKNQAISKLSQVQNDCKRGAQEDDEQERNKLLFKVLHDLATTLKFFADMSVKTNNICATSVLDQENIKKEIGSVVAKLKSRP